MYTRTCSELNNILCVSLAADCCSPSLSILHQDAFTDGSVIDASTRINDRGRCLPSTASGTHGGCPPPSFVEHHPAAAGPPSECNTAPNAANICSYRRHSSWTPSVTPSFPFSDNYGSSFAGAGRSAFTSYLTHASSAPIVSASSPYPSPPLSHGRPGSSCGNGLRWSPIPLSAGVGHINDVIDNDDDDMGESGWSPIMATATDLSTTGHRSLLSAMSGFCSRNSGDFVLHGMHGLTAGQGSVQRGSMLSPYTGEL